MIATITGINSGLTGQGKNGEYEYMDFSYQPEPYQGQTKPPVTRKVFANLPVHDDILDFEIGDVVDLSFEKNGKYSNLVAIAKAANRSSGSSSPAQAGNQATAKQGGGKNTYPTFDERVALDKMKDRSIQRQVALKCAVELEIANKAKGKLEVEDVLTSAKELYNFLQGNLPKDDAGVDYFNGDDDIPF